MNRFTRLAARYRGEVDGSWNIDSLTAALQNHFGDANPDTITNEQITQLLQRVYGTDPTYISVPSEVVEDLFEEENKRKKPRYEPSGTGFWGGVKDGYLLAQQPGYLGDDDQVHPRFTIPFYKPSKFGEPTYPDRMTSTGYRVGRILGDLTGNAHRSWLWRAHPADFGSTTAFKTIVNTKGGLPKESLEATALGTAGAFLTVEALGQLSGNYNPLNLGQGMRPDGFKALSPDEMDARQSTAPGTDLIQRYLLGRRGQILDWEEFRQERPDVSFEKYQAYRDWQSGRTPDPLGAATFGIVKFNPNGIQNQPEAQIVGYNVTPTGILGAGTVIGAGVLLNKYLGRLRRASRAAQGLSDDTNLAL